MYQLSKDHGPERHQSPWRNAEHQDAQAVKDLDVDWVRVGQLERFDEFLLDPAQVRLIQVDLAAVQHERQALDVARTHQVLLLLAHEHHGCLVRLEALGQNACRGGVRTRTCESAVRQFRVSASDARATTYAASRGTLACRPS